MIFRRTPRTATEWIVRLQAGSLSWWDRHALTRWLSGSPTRLKELEAAQALNELVQRLDGSTHARRLLTQDLSSLARTSQVRRRDFALPSLATVAVAMVVAIVPWDQSPSLPHLYDGDLAQTSVGQIADYVLPDRSQITVAGASTVSIAFTDGRRYVALERGEAFFIVKPDANRPFVITAGTHKVTVTGTKFNVNYLAALQAMEVAVIEGTVRVALSDRSGNSNEIVDMRAGDVIMFSQNGASIRRNLSPNEVAAWRSRKLYFDSASLSHVLTEVNRYSPKPLVSKSQDIDRLALTGQFSAGDVESVLLSLRQLYGIEAQEAAEQWTLVSKQADAAPAAKSAR